MKSENKQDSNVTETEISGQEKDKNKKTSKGLGRKLRNFGLAAVAVASVIEGTGAVITGLTSHAPVTAETIKTDLAWPWNLGKSTASDVQKTIESNSGGIYNFPDKGTLNPNNSVVITDLQIIKDIPTLPTTPTVKNDVYLLEPVENLDVVNSVQYGMDLGGKSDMNPIFPEKYRQEAIKNNVKNMLLEENIPEGSVIIAPMDGVLCYYAMEVPGGTVGGAAIDYTAPDGTVQSVSIAGWGGSTNLDMTPLIEGLTPYTGNNAPGETVFASVKRGQPIMITLQPGNIVMEAEAQLNGSDSTDSWPTNINLISLPDPKTGIQKSVILTTNQ
jgi:hypothetical protein